MFNISLLFNFNLNVNFNDRDELRERWFICGLIRVAERLNAASPSQPSSAQQQQRLSHVITNIQQQVQQVVEVMEKQIKFCIKRSIASMLVL
jgi:hypothetical protein